MIIIIRHIRQIWLCVDALDPPSSLYCELSLTMHLDSCLQNLLAFTESGIDPTEHGAKMEDRFYNNKAFTVSILNDIKIIE